jgi:hypothetical protein
MNYTYADENGRGARVSYSPSEVRKEQYVISFRYGFTSISTLAIDLDDARKKVREIFGKDAELVEEEG